MSTIASSPATIQIRRSRLLGLVAAVAALAALVTWVVLTFAMGTSTATSSLTAEQQGYLATLPIPPVALEGATVVAGPNDGSGLTSAERSIGSYLFGTSTALTPAQLRTVRNYEAGAAAPLTSAQRSIGSYLFGTSTGLTPVEAQMIRDYQRGAR